MKKYILGLFIISLLIFLIFVLLRKSNDHQSRWKGEIIETSDRIIVRNPAEPAYKDYQLELEHLFTLGNQPDENYVFHQARGIGLDSQENIYVLDSGNFRIQVFDSNGKYLRTIGRRGQGPGEFPGFVTSFHISEKGYLYVGFGRLISRLTGVGEYDGSISVPFYLYNFFVDSNENIYGNIIEWHEETQNDKRSIVRLNREGKIEREYFHMWRERDQFRGDIVSTRTTDGKLIYGWSEQHLFYINHEEKDKLIEVVSAIPPLPFSKEEKNMLREQQKRMRTRLKDAPVPQYKAYIHKIIADDYGYIWIAAPPFSEERQCLFDVFDSRGRYLYRFNLKYFPRVITKNYLYSLRLDPDIGYLVEKVKMGNWPPH